MPHQPINKPSIFIKVFARIMALWALVSFVVTFLIIFIPSMLCYLLPQKISMDIFIAISRIWMRVWLTMVGCPLNVKGKEHFKKGETYIVTFNHNSFLDVPLSCPFVPSGNKTIAKDTFAKIPLFGWYYAKGSILVNRKSDSSRRESFEKMKNVLAMGLHMCIYPEGTRNRTPEPLKPFYDGAFKLSVATQKSILPCVLYNTAKALPTNKAFWFLPKKLYMQFLPPISPANKTVEELKNTVFNTMQEAYKRGPLSKI